MSLLNDFSVEGSLERFEKIGVQTDVLTVRYMINKLLKTFPGDSIKTKAGITHPGIKGFELAFKQCEILAGLVEHETIPAVSDEFNTEFPLPFLITDPLANGDRYKVAQATKRGWRIGLYTLSHESEFFEYIDTNATERPKVLVRCPYSNKSIVAQTSTIESPVIDFPNQWYGSFDKDNRKALFSVVVDELEEQAIFESYTRRLSQSSGAELSLL